jgi:transketolase
VETTTGPLGEGFANGVGMAIVERYLATRFNHSGHEIVDHFIYGIVGDGDLMEGVSHEAASLAGHLKLSKLIFLYDDNHISIEGSTDLTFTENRKARFEAYGWHVQEVDDGNDLAAIDKAILTAQKEISRPSLIAVRTHIGYGSPNKQDAAVAHGEPLGPEEIRLTKKNLGWPLEPLFFIPDEALKYFRQAVEKGKDAEEQWQAKFSAYKATYPKLANEWHLWMNRMLPKNWDKDVPFFPADPKGMATRVASGTTLNAIAEHVHNLLGGSADLGPSNKTLIKGEEDFQADIYQGRNLHFGVREHGMASIMNGMALHGGVIPYGSTFMVFSDHMRPGIRMAALMGLKVIYVFTHDSIGVGEDGATHQPVEQLASLRSIPNLTVIRPCDANEVAEAWRITVKSNNGPVALILSRQNVPVLDRKTYTDATGLSRGAYILRDSQDEKPGAILIATGTEIQVAVDAWQKLEEKGVGVRIVSMPSWELFDKQPEEYRREVLPPEIKARISIEAGVTLGWRRYVGNDGDMIGIDHFGASAPINVLYEKFGITADRVVEKVLALIG